MDETLPDGGYKIFDVNGVLIEHEIGSARNSGPVDWGKLTPSRSSYNTIDKVHTPIYDVTDVPSLSERRYLESLGYTFCNLH